MNSLTCFIGNQPKKVKWVWSVGPNLVQCEKTKKNWYFNGFFDILLKVYIYKHKVVFIEIAEWKLKAKLAWSTIFEGN